MNLKKINLIKVGFYLLVTVAILVGIWFYSNVITYIILSFFMAYLLNPAVRFLERRNISRTLSIIIVYIFLFSIILLTLLFLIPTVIKEGKELTASVSVFVESGGVDKISDKYPRLQKFDQMLTDLSAKLSFLNFDDFKTTISNKAKDVALEVPNLIVNSISSLVTIFTFLLIVPVVGFLLLKDQEKLRKQFFQIIPNKYFELTVILMEKFDRLLGTYIRALLIQIIIIGTLVTIMLSIIGINNSLIIGIFAGVANAIPYLGPLIGIIFAVASVIFSGKSLILVIWVIASMLFVQLLDNIFVYPIVMGRNTEMHPLVILLTVVAGSYAYGIIGMLVSVPLVFILKEMIRVLYLNLKNFEII